MRQIARAAVGWPLGRLVISAQDKLDFFGTADARNRPMRDHEAGGHMGVVGLAQQFVRVVHLMRRNGEHTQSVALPVHGVLQPKQPVPVPKGQACTSSMSKAAKLLPHAAAEAIKNSVNWRRRLPRVARVGA